MVAEDVLGFAGILPPTLRVYPAETHIAEKFHAYTMPRPNSRVKDLPDIPLIATSGPIEAKSLRAALDQTFSFRGTHDLPGSFPAPPSAWETPYAAMASADNLPWSNLTEVVAVACAFLEPVLATDLAGSWDADRWQWAAERAT